MAEMNTEGGNNIPMEKTFQDAQLFLGEMGQLTV